MAKAKNTPETALDRLRWPLRLTRAGMVAEQVTRAFWPLISVVLLVLAALMFGLHELVSLEIVWASTVLAALAGLAALIWGIRRFRWPTAPEARARLDATLPGRPIEAILDEQAIGASDAASQAVWQAHVERMAARAQNARAPAPDLRVSRRDPYALRYVATLAFVMALLFGSIFRIATVSDVVAGGGGLANGPTWEGWVQPPAHTGKPSLYLADIRTDALAVPTGSKVTIRLYGKVGALTVAETVSGRTGEIGSAADPNQVFEITRSGSLSIDGPGGQDWQIEALPDQPPEISIAGPVERGANGEMRLPFSVRDDYGVEGGTAEFALDLTAVDRRYGLTVDPEPRDKIVLDLPMPFNGDRRDFVETLIDNLSEHPWAGLPVSVTLSATDAAGQTTNSPPETITLPGRRFFDPLAAAIVEQRRDLLWSRTNGPRVAQILRAVSNRPGDIFESDTVYLKLRVAIRRLEIGIRFNQFTPERQADIAQALWDIAVSIEDGNLTDARERLRQAQERLQQAMRDGASDEEIAKLMEELRQAMQDYMQQLAQQQDQQNADQARNQDMQTITQEQLQEMLDRIQELMEQGRMSEAQELLDQLGQMMENMQVTEGEPGQQGQGQQSLEGLADTLRQQQGLSDETFSDLQERFDQQGEQGQQGDGQQGEGQQGQQQGQGQPGPSEQEGSEDQGGQGAQSGQQGRQGQSGPDGSGQQPGQGEGRGSGSDPAQGLADRQQALRQQLDQQLQNLPGNGGGSGGQDARDALDRAGRAMDDAEQALRDEDFAGALDNQAEALEALREGMRDLAEELAQQQSQQTGQQGEANGRATRDTQRDPLGRDAGAAGRIGTDEQLLQGEDVYRRAKELLDEIRRRSSEQDRPEVERNYLRRLLDRF